ncbi:outer membrane protein OmpA-like peptidoglycan-associated protein [Mesonia hippocampi]|uniref:Outer membrane protein OmpA-like peptidoglycan-associated protein n=1 Tax=Mesonia hippocampi TaxID=1628250 RepID=A0A840ET62_9FLAO|nr:OmpA family protein [Mesonia hippocampi]MBB4119723.1 outer membrane protein OmpA-like peptidoglycan-associated protein [Mesonia hippocampi]
MKITRYYIPAVALMLSLQINAQTSATKRADKHFDRLEYVEAIEDYEKLVKKGKADAYVYKQLAIAYHKVFNMAQAAKYYNLYMDAAEEVSAEMYYSYAQTLLVTKDYTNAKLYLKKFAQAQPNDSRAKKFLKNQNYLAALEAQPHRFEVEQLGINSSYIDFGGLEHGEDLYFVSARNKSRRTYGWNDQPTLDVYKVTKDGDVFGDPKPVEGAINTKYNEGTVAITEDGETMYFSRNDYTDGKYEADEAGIGRLKIYKATKVNGKWDAVKSLPFNDSQYTVAHPALSPDGKTLYFSSDMPGGFGGADLYKVSIDEEGNFGEPQNLGAAINTEGKENFPFIDKEGTLYFSSDGHLGLGGLDVFSVNKKGQVKNIGMPINSNADDFAFTFNPETKKGYVSSNRGELQAIVANDNIYEVAEIIPPAEIDLFVKVIDAETGAIIKQAQVFHFDENGKQLAHKLTAAQGTVGFMDLLAADPYSLRAEAQGYHPNTAAVAAGQEGEVNVTIELTPIAPIITEEEVVLNPIYFDFDKADILPQAALELDKLVGVMKKHPEMVILAESHTDSRGSATYNQKLSERRAKSTVAYIVSKGISADRISGKGVGEADPKINCGANCTEEQHGENRRSVFKIVEQE